MNGLDWMTEPDERDARRGYTRVSLATVNDDNVGPGGILRTTIMRSLDDPRCPFPTDALALELIRQAEVDAILRHRKERADG